jgi:hypothetical protein
MSAVELMPASRVLLFLILCGALQGCAEAPRHPEKRRKAPDAVAPVTHDAKRYVAVHWGKARGLEQNGGFVAVIDDKTGDEISLIKIYAVTYDGDMEADKQDVLITSLSLDENAKCLIVQNEKGLKFSLDLLTHEVTAPE